MNRDVGELQLPLATVARLDTSRKPRAVATRKLKDLLARAVATSQIRAIWVHGSYARGATTVGDIDLITDVDDPGEKATAAFDRHQASIHGRSPDSDVLKALGASGRSMIEAYAPATTIPAWASRSPRPNGGACPRRPGRIRAGHRAPTPAHQHR